MRNKPYNNGTMDRDDVSRWLTDFEKKYPDGYDPHLSNVLRDVFADREGEPMDEATAHQYQEWMSSDTPMTFEEWQAARQ